MHACWLKEYIFFLIYAYLTWWAGQKDLILKDLKPLLFSGKVSNLIYSSDDRQTDNRWGACSGVCAAGAALPRLHLSGREAWHDFAPSAHVKRRSNPPKLFPRAAVCFMQCERCCSWNTTLTERPWAYIACGLRPINNAASWLFVYARGLCHFIVFSWTLLTAYLWRVTEHKHPRMQMLRPLELADAAEKTRLIFFSLLILFLYIMYAFALKWLHYLEFIANYNTKVSCTISYV